MLRAIAFVFLALAVVGWFAAFGLAALAGQAVIEWRSALEDQGLAASHPPLFVGWNRLSVEFTILRSLFRPAPDGPAEADRAVAAARWRRSGLAVVGAMSALGLSIALFALSR